MSVATKRRFITNKVESELYDLVDGDIIAQVKGARGNNLHEVEDEFGETYVVSMPQKFRKAVWIRRGQFVIIRSIEEGDKVKGEIEHVLDEENVLYIRDLKKWPERFEECAEQMTRNAKRGNTGDHPMIDDDMLPPSDSDYSDEDNDDEEMDEGDEEYSGSGEDDNEDTEETESCNPNRAAAPE